MVKEQTGRTLQIEGELALSFFPWIGVEIGRTQLENAAGFGDQPFAKVEQVGVKVELLPIISQRFVVDTVILSGLHLNLMVNKKGQNNWDDLVKPSDEDAAEEKDKDEKIVTQDTVEKDKAAALPALDINGIKITDARLIWDDQKAGTYLVVDKLHVLTGQMDLGKQVELEVAFDFRDKKEGKAHSLKLNTEVFLEIEKQMLSVSDLELLIDDLQLKGDITATEIFAEPKANGHIKISEFIPRDVMRDLGLPAIDTQDPTALVKASFGARFDYAKDDLKLFGMDLKLDDTRILGQVAVTHFADPKINIALTVDSIDVDRYLPPPPADPASSSGGQASGSTATSSTAKPAQTTGDETLLPVETLRGFNLIGNLKIGKLKASGLHSENIEVGLQAKKGDIRVHPAKASLYQGSYNGDIRLDVRGKTPTLSMNERLTGVQAEPLFKDVANWDFIMGRADATAKLTSKGNSMNALKKGLNGDVQFSFKDGTIKGYNVGYMIQKTNAVLSGQPAPKQEVQKTDFSEFRGSATVRNGVVHNNDLLVTSPLLKITGSGKADLVKEVLDYRVKTEIVASIQLAGGDPLEKLKGVQIPLRISGSFYDPKYNLELGKVLEEKAKAKVKEKVKEKEQELKQKLQDKLKDRLKGLF
jgi:AsmA protein